MFANEGAALEPNHTSARKLGPLKKVQSSLLVIVMTNERSDIVLETKPKRFGIIPKFVLLRTDCFDLVQNLISFDGADSGTNSDILVSFLLDVGTIVECLWNVCGTFVPLLF